MTSLLDVRTGAQEPVILHLPPAVHSLGAAEEAIELADSYGVCDGNPLSESQRITLRAGLGERADGSWAATRVGDFGPRQGTGKSDKIAARELAGLILFGERLIIHTAHEFPTANESFLRLVAVFENYDDLRRRVARIRYANGEQGIELQTGQRLKYRARTGGSGRGFAKADLVVYDEAQHLSREHVAASGPAKLANPNSQTWYAGSGGMSSSAVAWALRRDAILQRGGRLAYTEATAELVQVVGGSIVTERPDPRDLEAWYRAIPGLGRWVTEEAEQALFDELGPELFARECLCVWDADVSAESGAVNRDLWASLADRDAERPVTPMFGVALNKEQTAAAIAAVGRRPDGLPLLSVVDSRPGTDWVIDRLAELCKSADAPVALDKGGPTGALLRDLEERKVRVVELAQGDYAQACGALLIDVNNRALRHVADPELDEAVRTARTRPLGERWAWARGASDIRTLEAATVALHGFRTRPSADLWGFYG